MAIALVAHPALGVLASRLGDELPVTGLYYPARSLPRDASLPFFTDLTTMLEETGARVCAFLSPYDGLHDDVAICLRVGVGVLCAGPVPKMDLTAAQSICEQTGARLTWGNIHHFSPLFNKALAQRRHPSFAAPVYLRLLAGAHGPGLLPTWWSAYNIWTFAVELLAESPSQLHISANNRGRAYHAVLTATTKSGASLQLVIGPQRPLAELTLLGRGGLVSASAGQGSIALASTQGTQLMQDILPLPEIAWLRDFSKKKDPSFPDESTLGFAMTLLSSLRRALKQRCPVELSL
jgi:hypothetical protein